VEAFRATLEEVAEADIILHVRDAAHPDTDAQRSDVLAVLNAMARTARWTPILPNRTIEVLNKADLLGGIAQVELRPGAIAVSALNGEGFGRIARSAGCPYRRGHGAGAICHSARRRGAGWRGCMNMAR
jgi:50S ribosomal subunit-associated GTPase HflX